MTVTVTATSTNDPSKSASATVNVVAPGQVTSTANVQVASYTVSPAAPGNVSVQFGTDMNYGLTTWTQPVPTGGGAVSLFVAGMKGNTLYHMRGMVQFADGGELRESSSENLRIRVELRRTGLPGLRCGAQGDRQHVRKKYACPHCEGKGENPQIDEGAGPSRASSVITLIWV